MAVLFTNNATASLINEMDEVTTTVSVDTEVAAAFPQPLYEGQWFPLTLPHPSGVFEIVHCTARVGGEMTVIRAREGTTAMFFPVGSRVDHRATAAALAEGVALAAGLITAGDEPPPDPLPNSIWYESDTGKLFIHYVDQNSSQWVETFSAASLATGIATTDWSNVVNKPATFPPTVPIAQADIVDLEDDITYLANFKAPIDNPSFNGTPLAPNPPGSDNSTRIATTSFVKAQGYIQGDSAALTGTPTAPTPPVGDNSTKIATTAFVHDYAPLDSPALIGDPTAPTQLPNVKNTRLATTEYVSYAINAAQHPLNMLVNPCMTISQENAMLASTVTSSITPYYACDQWYANWGFTTAKLQTGVRGTSTDSPEGASTGRIQSVMLDVSVVQATLGVDDYAQIAQRLEGYRAVDLKWPAFSGGVKGLLHFWVKFPLAGTFCVYLFNPTDNLSYVGEYTVLTANVWQEVVISIPVPATGNWVPSNSTMLLVGFPIAAGANLQGVANTWQTGLKMATSTARNGAAVIGKYLVSKVGFYADPAGLGTPPDWHYQNDSEELKICQRYYYRNIESPPSMYGYRYGTAAATLMDAGTVVFPVTMRSTPSVITTITAPTYVNCSALAWQLGTHEVAARVTVTAAGIYRAVSGIFAFNARLP